MSTNKTSLEAQSQPSYLGAVMPRCSSCKFWNTDREEFKKSNLGWGYCTNKAIRTPMHDTEWKNNNELNSNRNSIISSDFKGFLTEENRQKGIVGKEKISPFETGKVTNVNIREYFPYPESKSGKAISVSFKGINADRTLELILWHLNSIVERNPKLNE